MASFLASVGRAQPARDIAGVLRAKLNIEQGERRERLVNAQTALSAENLNQLRRKGQFEEQEMERLNRPYSIDALAPNIEGGPEGPMFKMMYRQAEAMGLVDKSSGGLGTINERDYGVLTKYMNETPGFAMKLSNTRMNYWRGLLGQHQKALRENPNDKKAQEGLQQAQMGLQNAIAQNKPLADFMAQQQDTEIKVAKELREQQESARQARLDQEKLGQEDEGYDKTKPLGGKSAGTGAERQLLRSVVKANSVKARLADETLTPMQAYRKRYRMNDDGTLFTKDVVAPDGSIQQGVVELEKFTGELGKRGGPKLAFKLAERHDDMVEIKDLLDDPKVQADLNFMKNSSLWNRLTGTIENRISTWMVKKGVAADTKTGETLVRIGMIASNERHDKLGTAVTGTEVESVKPWLLSSGDSLDTIMVKARVAYSEGEEHFRHFLDTYKNVADMSPFYDAFGIERFGGSGTLQINESVEDMSDEELTNMKM
jgi:hypothetical protein